MGARLVISKIILLLILLNSNDGYSQIPEPFHLNYNITNSEDCLNKRSYLEKPDKKNFYIGKEHFIANLGEDNVKTISEDDLKSIELQNISELRNQANKERNRLNDEDRSRKNKSITVLLNDKVFDTIYLYERINQDTIKRYRVKWIEEIE